MAKKGIFIGGFGFGNGSGTGSTPPGPTLLLDDYPGADFAFSLRKLSSTYAGFALQAKRTADSSTQDIGFVGEDLDSAALITFANGGECTISRWYDQSGSGFAIPLGAAPIITDGSGAITVNGNSNYAIDWSSTNELRFVANATQPSHYFAVCQDSLPSNGQHMIDGLSARQIIGNNAGNQEIYAGGFLNIGTASTNTVIIEALFNGGSSLLTYNDDAPTSGNAGSMGIDTLRIGTNGWDGYLTELVQYPTVQTSNSADIKVNINTYYSIY